MVSPPQKPSRKLLSSIYRGARAIKKVLPRTTTTTEDKDLVGKGYQSFEWDDSSSISLSATDTESSDEGTENADFDHESQNDSLRNEHWSGTPPLPVPSRKDEEEVNQKPPKQSLYPQDQEQMIGRGRRVPCRSRKLPNAISKWFAPSLIMINDERTKCNTVPLNESRDMDAVARQHACQMAKMHSLFHVHRNNLEEMFGAKRFGANVGRGLNLHEIHAHMMSSSVDASNRNNITDSRFLSMGVGTAKANDGTLYLCQIFSD